jgi:hypothetical protein
LKNYLGTPSLKSAILTSGPKSTESCPDINEDEVDVDVEEYSDSESIPAAATPVKTVSPSPSDLSDRLTPEAKTVSVTKKQKSRKKSKLINHFFQFKIRNPNQHLAFSAPATRTS